MTKDCNNTLKVGKNHFLFNNECTTSCILST